MATNNSLGRNFLLWSSSPIDFLFYIFSFQEIFLFAHPFFIGILFCVSLILFFTKSMWGCHCFLSVFLVFPLLSYFLQIIFCLLVCFGVTVILGALFKCKAIVICLLIFKRRHEKANRRICVDKALGHWYTLLWVSSLGQARRLRNSHPSESVVLSPMLAVFPKEKSFRLRLDRGLVWEKGAGENLIFHMQTFYSVLFPKLGAVFSYTESSGSAFPEASLQS